MLAQEKGRYVNANPTLIIAGLVKKSVFLMFLLLVNKSIKCNSYKRLGNK